MQSASVLAVDSSSQELLLEILRRVKGIEESIRMQDSHNHAKYAAAGISSHEEPCTTNQEDQRPSTNADPMWKEERATGRLLLSTAARQLLSGPDLETGRDGRRRGRAS